MKSGGGGMGVVPSYGVPAKRRWRGFVIAVLGLVILSMLVPLVFLLGLHNGFHSSGTLFFSFLSHLISWKFTEICHFLTLNFIKCFLFFLHFLYVTDPHQFDFSFNHIHAIRNDAMLYVLDPIAYHIAQETLSLVNPVLFVFSFFFIFIILLQARNTLSRLILLFFKFRVWSHYK